MPAVPPANSNDSVPLRLRREIRWDAMAAIIASFIGFLALLVAGYTAYVQRYTAQIQQEQVRAQVWPYLDIGESDTVRALMVGNKGVGPGIVRSVQLRLNGKPQADWNHALLAMGLPSHNFSQTTINYEVLSAGEQLQIIRFFDDESWQRFRRAALNRISMDICFCSTLGECWIATDRNIIGAPTEQLQLRVKPVAQCPRLPQTEVFNN